MDLWLPFVILVIACWWGHHEANKAFDELSPEDKANAWEGSDRRGLSSFLPVVVMVLALGAVEFFRKPGHLSVAPLVVVIALSNLWICVSVFRAGQKLAATDLPKAYVARIRRVNWVWIGAALILATSVAISFMKTGNRVNSMIEKTEKMKTR